MRPGDRHFACTRCGACCVRSPEVELSEAAALADTFVFRLLLRLTPVNGNERLNQFAAARVAGAPPSILTLSALPVDAGMRRCSALVGRLCSIHDRRPLSCRTVPLHYSRSDGQLREVFDDFVAAPGHECDVGPDSPALLIEGKVVDAAIVEARAAAVSQAATDRAWKRAIVGRMKRGQNDGLPSIDVVRANSAAGALSTSMRIAWQVAVDEGQMATAALVELLDRQIAAIDRMMAGQMSGDSHQTLGEMRAEYALALRAAKAA